MEDGPATCEEVVGERPVGFCTLDVVEEEREICEETSSCLLFLVTRLPLLPTPLGRPASTNLLILGNLLERL